MAQIKISELNELETIQDDDLFVVVDESEGETRKAKSKNVRAKNKPLIAVTDEEPTEFNEGDEYYNTDERLIYKAINSTTWSVEGKVPEEGIMYVVFPEKSTFAWDGSDLISVGGGSGSQVIVPGEEITEDTKLEIEDEDFDFRGSEITDKYSESTEVGYSANYVNKNITEVEDISSLITKTANVGTIYSLVAYKKGSRCYLNTIFDLNALGNVFTLDNSILPKCGEIETATNYDTNSTMSCFARINANVNSIEITLYGTKKDYCALHIEWEV